MKSQTSLESMPPEWKDAQSLDVMFSPVRNKKVNPRDFDRKYTFWKQSIEAYCKQKQKTSFTLLQLQIEFANEGRLPACLPDLIAEMNSNGDILTEDEYKDKLQSQSWGGWATQLLIKRPLRWSFTRMRNSMSTIDNSNVPYILIASLKSSAESLYQQVPDGQMEKITTLPEFKTMLKWTGESSDLWLLLQELQNQEKLAMREGKMFSNEEKDGEQVVYLKVRKPRSSSGLITDVEITMYNFQIMQNNLGESIETLENALRAKREKIKAHLKDGNKSTAKIILLEAKRDEKRIDSLFARLNKISTLKETMEEQNDNKVMLDLFKDALQQMQKQKLDLDEEDVDETMAHLGDVIDVNNDLQANLAQNQLSEDIDWEKELSAFMEENDVENSGIAIAGNENLVDELTTEMSKIDLPDKNVKSTLVHA